MLAFVRRKGSADIVSTSPSSFIDGDELYRLSVVLIQALEVKDLRSLTTSIEKHSTPTQSRHGPERECGVGD
ncbi:hypothetical protein Gpo141_00003774 [Globisporangium polare]